MTPEQAYQELTTRGRKIATLASCSSVLGWEERTYMPPGGAQHRADQQSLLAGLIHEWFVDPKIGELLSTIEPSPLVKDPNSIEAANVRELRRMYDRETKLPQALVEEYAQTVSLSQSEWVVARRKSDFKAFLPWLEKVIKLVRQQAECYGYDEEIYDALLDGYEPGMKTSEVSRVFDALRPELVELNKKIAHAPKRPDKSIVERPYDVNLQRIFAESVAAAMGFDFSKGRLDITTHPFCSTFGPGDTRITTRYNPNRLNDAFFGVMHESGHALYEMGVDKEHYYGMPCGDTTSLSLHESQSRLWENQVGRSREFWVYFYPQAQRIFRDALGGVSLDQFYGAINHSEPSHIRVEADEATYNLHIMLRFELERAIIKGDLKPADVPGEWNKRFKEYLGVEVDNDAHGCLQDIHWSSGSFGYFPTYCLGTLYSAQFFASAKKAIPDLPKQIEQGNLSGLLGWLRTNIHRHGGRYRAKELGEMVNGGPLSHQPLIEYMNKKYGEIYGF